MTNLGNPTHALERPIYEVLSANGIDDPAALTDLLLRTLNDHGVIEYGPKLPALLTQTGRAFVTVAMRPEVTVNELSLVIGSGTSTVTQAISTLARSNLVARTKVGRRNRYEIVPETAKNHPDITRFVTVVEKLVSGWQAAPVAITE